MQRHGLEIADASSQAPLSTVADVPSDKQGAREKNKIQWLPQAMNKGEAYYSSSGNEGKIGSAFVRLQ